MCAKERAYLSVGMTEIGGLWLRGQIVIAGRAKIAVSACLSGGGCARKWELNRYLILARVWISLPSHHTKDFGILRIPKGFGEAHGGNYTTLSNDETTI